MADLLKVGEIAVRFLTKKADLRAVNVGREWHIEKDLESVLQRHANPPSDDREVAGRHQWNRTDV
jgi:hypothetical protein